MGSEFHRIKRLPPYVFSEVNQLKLAARAVGKDIIDFGMGNPDMPTPTHIVDKMQETLRNPKTHGYSASRGINGLRKAVAGFYARRFSVEIDPETETIVTLGSKEGLANLASAITTPGDVILVPNPSYPIHQFGFMIAGASVRNVPVLPDKNYMGALESAVRHSVPKPIALVLNYPNNPTTITAPFEFYEEVVSFCKSHEIYILSDLAYSELYFDGYPPPSILEVSGAKDIAVEFTSMSKSYSMAGWRVGFATGNSELISALGRVKSYLDYGAFTPIQVAAAAALNGPDSCIKDIREIYKKRRDVLVASMATAGWEIPSPQATMFAWAPIPDKFKHLGSIEFSKLLLNEADVAVSPGVAFGEYGEGYVRISLVENEQRIRQAARNIKVFLAKELVKGKQTSQSGV